MILRTRLLLPLIVVPLLVAAPSASSSAVFWNASGHRVIAAIAFEELEPEDRRAIVELLKHHPAVVETDDWKNHPDNGDDPDLNLLMNASVFPDEARSAGPLKKYDIGRAHYVNFRIVVNEGGSTEVLPPIQDLDDDDPHGDILESIEENLRIARDCSASPSERALAISWIIHQVGDLHQPLHNVARFCPATPNGDRGGNEIKVGRGNLHSVWDRALGTDPGPGNVEALAGELMAEFPRDRLADRLAEPEPKSWSAEGVGLALRYVYRDLDPRIAEFPELPVGYGAEARSVARSQCTLAGYRLADLLRSVVRPGRARNPE